MLLRRAFDLIELLAFGGTYTDTPTDPAGSPILTQILHPLRVPYEPAGPADTYLITVNVPKHVVGDLLAGTAVGPTGPHIWAPLNVLTAAGTAVITTGNDGRHEIYVPALRDLVLTHLVGFPLAVYPFFDNPYDPLGHFDRFVADYFPDIARRLGETPGARTLHLSDGIAQLRLWTDHARLYADLFDATLRDSATVIICRTRAIVSLRLSYGEAPASATIEDLSAVSCRDVGAVKRRWAISPGRAARAMASDRRLINDPALIAALCRQPDDIAGAGLLVDAADHALAGGSP